MAALAAGVLLSRQQQRVEQPDSPRMRDVPAGEKIPAHFELEELRKAGF